MYNFANKPPPRTTIGPEIFVHVFFNKSESISLIKGGKFKQSVETFFNVQSVTFFYTVNNKAGLKALLADNNGNTLLPCPSEQYQGRKTWAEISRI